MSGRKNNSNRGRKHNVHCVKPSDPPFLRALKERCGYKDGPNINTKRQMQRPDPNDSDEDDRDDERPQVVVLREGDLTQKEADELLSNSNKEDRTSTNASTQDAEGSANSSGKTVFSSASKRRKDGEETAQEKELSSKKKKLQEDLAKKKNLKAVKDNRLLSFGDDEEEEDDE